MENLIYIAPVAAVIGLAFGALKASQVRSADAGDETMKDIAGRIQEGAMAFLKAEYKWLAVFVVVVGAILATKDQHTNSETGLVTAHRDHNAIAQTAAARRDVPLAHVSLLNTTVLAKIDGITFTVPNTDSTPAAMNIPGPRKIVGMPMLSRSRRLAGVLCPPMLSSWSTS